MFDIGWFEIALIVVVALVVLGPKDFVRALHRMGQWAGRIRYVIYSINLQIERSAEELEEQSKKIELQKTMISDEILDVSDEKPAKDQEAA